MNNFSNQITNLFVGTTTTFLDEFSLIFENLVENFQNRLSLTDIESILYFIVLIRFIILSIKYNLRTSFYITCIGLMAGYFWYKHFIDVLFMYRAVLVEFPFLKNWGLDIIQLQFFSEPSTIEYGQYNLVRIIYDAFKNGITNIDFNTGLRYFIDPISMIVSNLPDSFKSTVFPVYYSIYMTAIPKIVSICSKLWAQLSGIAIYVMITRIGKRYCPYLIRWHWTFLLIVQIIEQMVTAFINRALYFKTHILIPEASIFRSIPRDLVFQITFLNLLILIIVCAHLSFILFALFHALCGQYFYIPFLVPNTELHIGPRPRNSIYSGGKTAWQNPEEKNARNMLPKIWYGWLGRGTQTNSQFYKNLKKILKKFRKILTKKFKRKN